MNDYFARELRERYLLLKLLAWFDETDKAPNPLKDRPLHLPWAVVDEREPANYG